MMSIGRLGLVMGLVMLVAGEARAQLSMRPLNGAATVHVGTTVGDDVSGARFTLGGSVSVVESTGWGAEFDFGFVNGDDNGTADRANLQTFTLNLIGIWPTGRFRPFFIAGAGGMRLDGCTVGCTESKWTDWALTTGGGVQYLVNPMMALRGDVRFFTGLQDHSDPTKPDDFDFWRISAGVALLWNVVP
jgi:opacity protein-like surface antigen